MAGPGNDDGKGLRAARCRKLRRGDEATIVLRATISVLQGLSLSNERGGRTNVEILIMQTQKHEHTQKGCVHIDQHLHTQEHIRTYDEQVEE